MLFGSFFAVALAATAPAPSALQDTIRPQLPPHVDTIAQAADYYLAGSGYRLQLSTPRTGDARLLAAGPAPRPEPDADPVTRLEALQALAPTAYVYVFQNARVVAFGDPPPPPPAPPTEQAPVPIPADPIASQPEPASASEAPPAAGAASAAAQLPTVDAVEEDDQVYVFHVTAGSSLKVEMERATSDAGYQLVWLAGVDFPLIASASFQGSSLPRALAESLRETWRLNTPLVLTEAPNHVLVVHAP